MIAGIIFGFLPLAIWLYLLLFRDGFWRLAERDSLPVRTPERWPSVVAVVPARNEADVIQHSIGSLLAQTYPGDFRIVLVDDQSEDGTGDLARALDDNRLTVLTGAVRPPGWTGKLWAMKQGAEHAISADFVWFTDADIAHAPDNLSRLVSRAEEDGKVLVSLMARLSCKTAAEHFLIPAFVFFFDMLFPFGAVNNPRRKIAAAAGGCMLVRRTALEAAGGIAAIRHNIIDDCALARALKAQGPIWLGLTDRAVSLRPYEHLSDIRHMVSRSGLCPTGLFAAAAGRYAAGTGIGLYRPGHGAAVRLVLCAIGGLAGLDHHGGHVPADPAFLSSRALVGFPVAADRRFLCCLHAGLRDPALVGPGRHVEGPAPGRRKSGGRKGMSISDLQSGKGHKDENFPVASFLIAPQHRPAVLAFYRFVRAADDVADHATALPAEKLNLLEQMRASLVGDSDAVPEGVALREVLVKRGLAPTHALDLLEAFRRDCTKLRYADWDELIDYCRYSAMPVGRFVLDVHGEDRALWPANDALCAALQIINHLQDCGKDFHELNRVYIPLDAMAAAGITPDALAGTAASPALLTVIAGLAAGMAVYWRNPGIFFKGIRDGRLALEVDLIQTLAEDLNATLGRRDPLSQKVHHSKTDVAALFVKRFPAFALQRTLGRLTNRR